MVAMSVGDRCVIHTPGGGGWGDVSKANGYTNGEVDAFKPAPKSTYHPRAAGSLAAFAETQAGSS